MTTGTVQLGHRAAVDAWLRSALDDADRRALPELRPLLEGLAQSTLALRGATWRDTLPVRAPSSPGSLDRRQP